MVEAQGRVKWVKTTRYKYNEDGLPTEEAEVMWELPESEAVETVVEVKIDHDPSTVKEYTDQGYVVQGYYSGKVQLVKYREPEKPEEKEAS